VASPCIPSEASLSIFQTVDLFGQCHWDQLWKTATHNWEARYAASNFMMRMNELNMQLRFASSAKELSPRMLRRSVIAAAQ
jgi:hypothetical protein